MGTVTSPSGHELYPLATVEQGAVIGDDTMIWHGAHVRSTARIGARCVIGKDVYVDAGVVIGDGVKVQNGVSIYYGVVIEADVFIGPHVTFTNDVAPRAFGEWAPQPTRVRRGASIGANATILCGLTIGEYAMVAAGAVVTHSVQPYALMRGNPARLVGYVCKRGHSTTQIGPATYLCNACAARLDIRADWIGNA